MPVLVLDLLKFAFLIVLYIFIARAVKAVYLELRPETSRRKAGKAAPAPSRQSSRKSRRVARKVAVVENDQLKGQTFDLKDELVIGRADKCHIVLDDTYVSQVHARIFAKDDTFIVEDLGSTNGTYLNRRRISAPTELQKGDQVKIGKTVLEMRR